MANPMNGFMKAKLQTLEMILQVDIKFRPISEAASGRAVVGYEEVELRVRKLTVRV